MTTLTMGALSKAEILVVANPVTALLFEHYP